MPMNCNAYGFLIRTIRSQTCEQKFWLNRIIRMQNQINQIFMKIRMTFFFFSTKLNHTQNKRYKDLIWLNAKQQLKSTINSSVNLTVVICCCLWYVLCVVDYASIFALCTAQYKFKFYWYVYLVEKVYKWVENLRKKPQLTNSIYFHCAKNSKNWKTGVYPISISNKFNISIGLNACCQWCLRQKGIRCHCKPLHFLIVKSYKQYVFRSEYSTPYSWHSWRTQHTEHLWQLAYFFFSSLSFVNAFVG